MKNFTKTYKNGLRLVFEKNNNNVVAINILFDVGSQNETSEQEGYSHFIEHMIFKSSKDYSTFDIMDKLTMLGADYNAYTSKTVTRFIFKCLPESFEKCFEIYSNILLFPKFDDAEMDKEREVVIEEMKKCADDPVEVMYERAMKNYFYGTGFAHDVLGSEEIIKKVSRKKLLSYKEKYYRAENCIISVAGNIDFEELDRIVEKYFSSHFNYESKPNKVNFKKLNPNIIKKYDIIERPDNQANVCLHINSTKLDSEDKYACDIYTSILGGLQNSRLFKHIREELGLVYNIYAFNELGSKSGEMLIIFGTRPNNIKKAIYEIRKILNELAENGISQSELERSKNWKKSCLAFGSEANANIAEINGSYIHLYGKVKSTRERIKNIESVTLDEVNRFAKKIANEDIFNVVGVGKNLKIEDLEQF